MTDSADNSVVTLAEQELLFLVARYLSSGPCKKAAAALREDLASHALLPSRHDWRGFEHYQTYEELCQRHPHITPKHLINLLHSFLNIWSTSCQLDVVGLRSLLGSGRHSLSNVTTDSQPAVQPAVAMVANHHGRPAKVSATLPALLMARQVCGFMHRQSVVKPEPFYKRIVRRRRIFGHLCAAYCILYDRTGTRVITGADDCLLKIWSAHDCRLLGTLRGPHAEVADISVDYDNQLIASGGCDKIIRVWNLQTMVPVAVLKGHSGTITSLQFGPWPGENERYLVSTGSDGNVCFWEYNPHDNSFNSQPIKFDERTRPGDRILCSSFSAGGSFLVAGSTDHLVRIYRVNPGPPEPIAELEGHTDRVQTVQFSHNGYRFISGGRDGLARIWTYDFGQWKCIILSARRGIDVEDPQPGLKVQKLKVTMVAWDLHDKHAITASNDLLLRVWDSRSGHLVHTLPGHEDEVYVLEAHPVDPRIFLSTGHDGLIILWNIVTGQELKKFSNLYGEKARGAVFDCKFAPDGFSFTCTDSQGQVTFFGLKKEADQEVPEQQFFHTDYHPLLRDMHNNVVDQQTELAPHLMPPPLLVNMDGNPYPPEVQRLVTGYVPPPLQQEEQDEDASHPYCGIEEYWKQSLARQAQARKLAQQCDEAARKKRALRAAERAANGEEEEEEEDDDDFELVFAEDLHLLPSPGSSRGGEQIGPGPSSSFQSIQRRLSKSQVGELPLHNFSSSGTPITEMNQRIPSSSGILPTRLRSPGLIPRGLLSPTSVHNLQSPPGPSTALAHPGLGSRLDRASVSGVSASRQVPAAGDAHGAAIEDEMVDVEQPVPYDHENEVRGLEVALIGPEQANNTLLLHQAATGCPSVEELLTYWKQRQLVPRLRDAVLDNDQRLRRALGEQELQQFALEHQRSTNPHVQLCSFILQPTPGPSDRAVRAMQRSMRTQQQEPQQEQAAANNVPQSRQPPSRQPARRTVRNGHSTDSVADNSQERVPRSNSAAAAQETLPSSDDSSDEVAFSDFSLPESSSHSSDYSDWTAEAGITVTKNNTVRKRVRRRVEEANASDASDGDESGDDFGVPLIRQPTSSSSSSVRREKKAPKKVRPPAKTRKVEDFQTYFPPSWILMTSPQRSPYFPQIGDTVVFCRQGYERYLEEVRTCKAYRIDPRFIPWRRKKVDLRAHEVCRVMNVYFEVGPPTLCTLKLGLVRRGPDGLPGVVATFSMRYHDMDNVLDCLVLYQHFKEAVELHWKAGDRFQCLIDSEWWEGAILERKPFDAVYTDSLWLCFVVRWDDGGDVEQLSPWDMEPLPSQGQAPSSTQRSGSSLPKLVIRTRRQSAQQASVDQAVDEQSAADVERWLFADLEEAPAWGQEGEEAARQRLVAGLDQVKADLDIAVPFREPVDYQNAYPTYCSVVAFPTDITTIFQRLNNGFYRRQAALLWETRLIEKNARTFNEEDSEIVRSSIALAALLQKFIRTTTCSDPVGLYQSGAILSSGDDEVDVLDVPQLVPSYAAAANAGVDVSGTVGRNAAAASVGESTAAPTTTGLARRVTRAAAAEAVIRRAANCRKRKRGKVSETLSDKRPSRQAWWTVAEHLVEELCAESDAAPFRDPVDGILYPDYLDVIEKPMDFATLLDQLHMGKYTTPEEFCADVRLIFNNSRSYNTIPFSEIFRMTSRLSAKFETRVISFFQECRSRNSTDVWQSTLTAAMPTHGSASEESDSSVSELFPRSRHLTRRRVEFCIKEEHSSPSSESSSSESASSGSESGSDDEEEGCSESDSSSTESSSSGSDDERSVAAPSRSRSSRPVRASSRRSAQSQKASAKKKKVPLRPARRSTRASQRAASSSQPNVSAPTVATSRSGRPLRRTHYRIASND